MLTDVERREKARSLRDLCGRDYGEAGVPIDDIERALGVDPVLPGSYDPDDVDTLAGLIDPGPDELCGEWRGDPRHDAVGDSAAHEDDELWCEHCDKELDEDWAFCPWCGRKIREQL